MLGFAIFAAVFVTVLTLVVRFSGLRVRAELPDTKSVGLTVAFVGLTLIGWWFVTHGATVEDRILRPSSCPVRWKCCRRFPSCTSSSNWCAAR